MDKELSRLLDESIQLEMNAAALYLSFYRTFPEDAEFWWQLAMEEKNHAALLKSAKQGFVDEGYFPPEILTTNLDALVELNKLTKELLDEHKRKPPSRGSTFEIALKLEQSAGEIDFNLTMEKEGDSPALKLFKRLNKDDKDHTRRIQDYMRRKGIGKSEAGE